jgi:glycosyltransferase involved in cell wall biosynthesis
VWIVGSGTHPDNAFRTSTTIEAGQQIELLPPQPESEMRMLYARAAIYAATSRYEPFGLAPLEAALSGCALVANDIASFREIWGDAAIYFDRNDPVSLAKVIACLSADGELRSSWAERAYQRARKQFTADRMVNDYMGLYASLTRAEVAAA